MSLSSELPARQPRLGMYYAIFASALASLVVLLLILEQLGARKLWLSHVVIVAPVLTYLGIAAVARTLDVREFYSAGRHVPPVFGGFALAATTLGGSGLFAFTGLLYLLGVDAMGLALGWTAGLLFAGILFVPYLRKAGTYTLAGFLRLRFDDRVLAALAALLVLPPAILLLAAELKLAAFIVSLFVTVREGVALTTAAGIMAAIPILGGMRSLTWAQCAQYLVVAAGYLVPLVIVAVMLTNLPFPQLSYGALMERLAAQEIALGAPAGEPGTLGEALSGAGLQVARKPFEQLFGGVGQLGFLAILITFLCGTAASPALLMRAGTAPSVFEARRAIGWGVLFLAVLLLSAPACAAFVKFMIAQDLVGSTLSRLPHWVIRLREAGLADIGDANGDRVIAAGEISVASEGLVLALPIIGGFPFVLVALVAASGIAATLAAGSAQAAAIGASVGEDLLHGFLQPTATPNLRLLAARGAMAVAAVIGAWIVAFARFEVLAFVSWAASLVGSAFLPVLVLAIWWQRSTSAGALAGMASGFVVCALHIWYAGGTGAGIFGISGLAGAVIAVPVGAAVMVAVSLLTPVPEPAVLKLVSDIRDPGGRTIYDRLLRRAARAPG